MTSLENRIEERRDAITGEPTAPDTAPDTAPATALAVVQESPAPAIERHEALAQSMSVMGAFWDLAEKVAQTVFAGAYRGKTEEVFTAFMKGHEVGLQPMQALDSIDVIQGKPTLKPEVMRALIRQQGHDFEIVEMTDDRCVMKAHRRNWTPDRWTTYEFTMDHARELGLLGKDNWKKQRRVMLFARCTGLMARADFADVIKGLSYTPDEILDSIEVTATPVAVPKEVEQAAATAVQPATASDYSPAPPEVLEAIRNAIALLSQEAKVQLAAWWKSGAVHHRADALSTAEAEIVTAKILELKGDGGPDDDTPVEAEIVEDSPGSSGIELLKVVRRERDLTPPECNALAGFILHKVVKRIDTLTDDEARNVAEQIEQADDEALAALLAEATS